MNALGFVTIAVSFGGTAFLFARHGGQTQPALSWRRPDQGEDNPNRKGVAGNGRV